MWQLRKQRAGLWHERHGRHKQLELAVERVSKIPAQVFNILKGAEIQAPIPSVRCALQKTAKPT